ncbi:transposase [Bradyrhizobium elkanii]|nr:transposase [Bradyrhizobium elkanii]
MSRPLHCHGRSERQCSAGRDPVRGAPAEFVIADADYDADRIREAAASKGARAVGPNRPSRAIKHPLEKHLYKQGHFIECCFSKLKRFRRIATYHEMTPRNYLAILTIAATVLWLR